MAKFFALILSLMIFGLLQPVHALEITFKPGGVVTASDIRLGDIVNFDEKTETTMALATLTVSQAPPPGEEILLRSLAIKDFLVSSQSLPQDIRWTGSPTVRVLREGITIGPERVQQLIADYINNNRNNLPDAEIRFVPSSLPLPFILPMGELSEEIIPSNPGILGSSRFSVIFRVDRNVVKNMSVRGKVEALAPVVITNGPLKRGTILSAQYLTTELMDIGSINNPELDLENLLGKRLTRSLRSGSPILKSMVESLPIVHRGERVKMVVSSGPLQLTATGFAQNNGILNQMIRVQNSNSNKIIHCRVAAPGLVEVML